MRRTWFLAGFLPAICGIAFSQTVPVITSPATLPTADLCENTGAVSCSPYRYQFTSGGGIQPITWSVTPPGSSIPGNLSLSSGGLLSGIVQGVSSVSFSIVATDARQTSSEIAKVSVPVNAPASIATTTLPNAVQNATYSIPLNANYGTPPFTWTPIQPQTGQFAFPSGITPFTSIAYVTQPIANGDRLVVGNSNAAWATALQNVQPGNPTARDFFANPSIELVSGQPFLNVYLPTVAERNGNYSDFAGLLIDPQTGVAFPGGVIPLNRLFGLYAFRIGPNRTAATALPPGLTLSPAGLLSGTPTTTGTYNIYVQATDSALGASTVTTTVPLQLTVTPALVPIAPTFPPAEAGNLFSFPFTAIGSSPFAWSADAGILSDAWSLSNIGATSGQIWTQLSTTGWPSPPRAAASAIFDPATSQVMVFGGATATDPNSNDVWSLTTGSTPQWQRLSPTGTPPPARSGASAVYDSRDIFSTPNSAVVIFGGGLGSTSPCSNDTWVLNNANGLNGDPNWFQVDTAGTLPAARINHTAVYDRNSGRMIVFGGNNCQTQGAQFYNDVWILTNASALSEGSSTWLQPILNPLGQPPARENHTAVYDSGNNVLIVFGGINSVTGGPALNDVWILSSANGVYTSGSTTSTWTQLNPSGTPPPGRGGAGAVYDAETNRMYVFGGNDGTQRFNDVWVLTNANGRGTPTWTQLNPASPLPSARSSLAAVYDSNTGRMFVFGGQSASSSLPSGLRLNRDGSLTGRPDVNASGTYKITAFVSDASGQSLPVSGQLVIAPQLTITSSTLRSAQAGAPYSEPLSASGGVGQLTWSLAGGTLPQGLRLLPDGTISGTPNTTGSSQVSVRVTDSLGVVASGNVQLLVDIFPQTPTLTPTVPNPASARMQIPFQIMLGSPNQFQDIHGTLTLGFTPAGTDPKVGFVPAVDPTMVFMNGKSTLDFTIPAGQPSTAVDDAGNMLILQTGTTAGTIALNFTGVQWQSRDRRATQAISVPTPQAVVIPQGPPQLSSLEFPHDSVVATRTSGGFTVTVTGYSTSRQITSASFQFSGRNLATKSLTLPQLADKFTSWYQSSDSNPYGSSFTLDQLFTLPPGSDASVDSVTVTLASPQGNSQPITAVVK